MQLDTFVVGVDPENSWQLNLTVDFVWLARRRRRRKDRNDVLSHSWTQDGPVYKFRDRQKGCRRSGRTFSRPINGAKPVEHLLNFFALVLFTADEISLWNATKFPSAWVEKNNAYISPLIIELFRLFVVTKVVRWTRNRRPWKKSICKLWRNPKLLEFSWLESGYLAIPPTYRWAWPRKMRLLVRLSYHHHGVIFWSFVAFAIQNLFFILFPFSSTPEVNRSI